MDRFTAKQLCVIFRQLILLQESQHLQEQLVQSACRRTNAGYKLGMQKGRWTLSEVTWSKNEAKHTMSFTIKPDDAVRPYVIVPDNTEKPAATKKANIVFMYLSMDIIS